MCKCCHLMKVPLVFFCGGGGVKQCSLDEFPRRHALESPPPCLLDEWTGIQLGTRTFHQTFSKIDFPPSFRSLNETLPLLYLDIFGVLSDEAIALIQNKFPSVGINKFIHSAVARPTVGTRRTSVWGLRTRDGWMSEFCILHIRLQGVWSVSVGGCPEKEIYYFEIFELIMLMEWCSRFCC